MEPDTPPTLTPEQAHASDLRHMIYTLTRRRHFSPKPPYQLGGMLLRSGDEAQLIDAQSAVSLSGPLGDLRTGDWVTLKITNDTPKQVTFASATLVRRTEETIWSMRPHAAEFALFLERVRQFFLENQFREVHTPTLVTCPGLEPSLEPFATEFVRGREKSTVYLPTSPEIHLKKALAKGYTDLFEVRPCFRRGEFSEHHESEFFMLEWYRAFADLSQIVTDLQALLDFLSKDSHPPVLRETTWRELFAEEFNFPLTPETTGEQLRQLCREQGLHEIESDSFNDLFNRLVIDKIDPGFKARGPLIVRDFPPSQAALAKLTAQGWADRFEFYWQGLEIANAFNEVTEPEEQIQRWQAEQDERHHMGTTELPLDMELVGLMRKNSFPPTGGIALGVERMYMAFYGVSDIKELKLFAPISK